MSGSSSTVGSPGTKAIARPPRTRTIGAGTLPNSATRTSSAAASIRIEDRLDVVHGHITSCSVDERLSPPLEDVDHVRGERGAAAGAGDVRRLPVPLLPRRPVGPAPGPRAARRPARLRLPPPADPRAPPAGAAGGRSQRGGRRPGQLLGVPRRPLRGPAQALARDDARGRPATSASTPSGWRRRSTPAPTATASTATSTRPRRAAPPAPRPSSSTASATSAPTTPPRWSRRWKPRRIRARVKALVQRVSQAAVDVEGERVAQIGPGMLVLLGVGIGDGEEQADRLADKVRALRIFDDAEGQDERAAGRSRGPLRQPVHPLRRRSQGQPAQLRRRRPARGRRAASTTASASGLGRRRASSAPAWAWRWSTTAR